jgi:GTP-binding protein
VNKHWRLVDLPGYGYASTGKDMRHKFGTMVADYITQRDALRCLMVLIDSKISPQQIDLDFLQWLIGEGIPFVLVFTKIDRFPAKYLQPNIDAFLERMKDFAEGQPMYLACSSRTRAGIAELHALVRQVLEKEGRKFDEEFYDPDANDTAMEASAAVDEEEDDED